MVPVLEYLFNRLKADKPAFVTVGAQDYAVKSDGTLGSPIRELEPQWDMPALPLSTLSALKAAVEAKIDDFPEQVALQVVDYKTVALRSTKADKYGKRRIFVFTAHAEETPFAFDNFMSAEKFNIDFRASFMLNDEAVKVLKVVSNLESGQQVSVADDGLSQQIEIKSGTVSKMPVVLPADGIPLIPWRTFRDAAPVESKFLLRLRPVKDGLPMVALYEIDAKWKLDTINSVANWLRTNIPGVQVIA